MAGELQLLGKLISVALDILGISNAIKKATEQTAQEHAPYAIETIASNGTNTVINPTYGNSALRQLLLDVLTGIDVPNSTVILPPVPPAGYGGGVSNAEQFTINSLYQFDNSYRGDDLNDAIESSHDHATMIAAQAGYLDSRNPYFALVGPSSTRARVGTRNHWGYNGYPAPDAIDWSLWDGASSLVAFLNAQETTYAPWDNVSPDGVTTPGVAWAHFYGYDDTHWRCLVYEWMLPMVSGRAFGASTATATPPVWPSLAEVTLGDPVALSDDLTVEGPLDGVLIHVTNIPKGLGRFTTGERTFFYKCGEIAFVSDNGYVEPWQYLTWDHGLYTPKCMQHADHAIIRALSDAAGTATPWSVTV